MIGYHIESQEFSNFVWLENYRSDTQIVNCDSQ